MVPRRRSATGDRRVEGVRRAGCAAVYPDFRLESSLGERPPQIETVGETEQVACEAGMLLSQDSRNIAQPLEAEPFVPGAVITEEEEQKVIIQVPEANARQVLEPAMAPELANLFLCPGMIPPV